MHTRIPHPSALALTLTLLLLFAVAWPQSAVSSGKAYIAYLSGKVSVLKAGSTAWKPAAQKSALSAGDQVKTGANSCAVLTLEDRSTLKLNGNTHILLQKIQPKDQSVGTKVQVFVGNMWTDVNSFFYQKSSFEVESGKTTASVRGTAFDTTYDGDELRVKEWEGSVSLDTEGRKEELATFEELTLKGESLVKRAFDAGQESVDDWNSWNNYIDSIVEEQGEIEGQQEPVDIEALSGELDALPELGQFAAGLGGLLDSSLDVREKVMERVLRRLPEGYGSVQRIQLEKRYRDRWQGLSPEQREHVRKSLELTRKHLQQVDERLKNLPPEIRQRVKDAVRTGRAQRTAPKATSTPAPAHGKGAVPAGFEAIEGNIYTTEMGNRFVPAGKELNVMGALCGDLHICPRAEVTVQGTVNGNVTNCGKLVVLGRVNGNVVNLGGTTTVLGSVSGEVIDK